mmetsp:Transcript_40021/g.129042  ORF Transcript_40021/g.129042 Transcript_40021/m.129042 type:complete len:331 (-) Transcript_40021:176-1168(-)
MPLIVGHDLVDRVIVDVPTDDAVDHASAVHATRTVDEDAPFRRLAVGVEQVLDLRCAEHHRVALVRLGPFVGVIDHPAPLACHLACSLVKVGRQRAGRRVAHVRTDLGLRLKPVLQREVARVQVAHMLHDAEFEGSAVEGAVLRRVRHALCPHQQKWAALRVELALEHDRADILPAVEVEHEAHEVAESRVLGRTELLLCRCVAARLGDTVDDTIPRLDDFAALAPIGPPVALETIEIDTGGAKRLLRGAIKLLRRRCVVRSSFADRMHEEALPATDLRLDDLRAVRLGSAGGLRAQGVSLQYFASERRGHWYDGIVVHDPCGDRSMLLN